LLITFLLNGCGNDKLAKCREIITIAVEIDQKTKENLNNKNAENVLAVADIFEKNSTQIKKIIIKDEQLNKYSKELGEIYQKYAETTRNFIVAFQDKNVEQAVFYKEEISKLFQKQQQLVTEINSYCQGNVNLTEPEK
jgi:mevalonate kinase